VAPAEEREEIDAGEVKVEDDEGAIEATSEVEHGGDDSEDIGTSSQQHYGSSMVYAHSPPPTRRPDHPNRRSDRAGTNAAPA